jgi:hypothetical protein
MRVLANKRNYVSELVMTSNHLPTGINYTIFHAPCEEYDNFATVLKNPGFHRLDIAMLINRELEEDIGRRWRSFLNGRLRRALGEAKPMEHFRLHTTATGNLYDDDVDRLIPLQSIVPIEKWPRLRHFLSRFLVSQSDITSFLAALPKSVRSIELSMPEFLIDGGDYYGLLDDIRKMIRQRTLWLDRDITARPKLSIGLPLMYGEIGRGD